MSTATISNDAGAELGLGEPQTLPAPRWVDGDPSLAQITADIAHPLEARPGRGWWICLAIALAALLNLLAAVGYLFASEQLSAMGMTIGWMIIFFFASAAASAAYLTVSETFPLEIRALAIAFFYAVGTGIGGIAGPWLFGVLIESGSRGRVLIGYLIGAGLMLGAAAVAAVWAVAAERKSLEHVSPPLSSIDH